MIRIDWQIDAGELTALEPTRTELEIQAHALSVGYNDPANAELMGHTEALSPADVVDSYTEAISAGMRAFLLFHDDVFVGDADLRNIRGTSAEFAFMIANPTAQGKGLGTKFALMIHAFGFQRLELRRIYASVVPHNVASRRVFEKIGYVVDESPEARAYAEEPDDVTLALDRGAFFRTYARDLSQIRIGVR